MNEQEAEIRRLIEKLAEQSNALHRLFEERFWEDGEAVVNIFVFGNIFGIVSKLDRLLSPRPK